MTLSNDDLYKLNLETANNLLEVIQGWQDAGKIVPLGIEVYSDRFFTLIIRVDNVTTNLHRTSDGWRVGTGEYDDTEWIKKPTYSEIVEALK